MNSKLEKAIVVLGLSAITATYAAMAFSAMEVDQRLRNRPVIKTSTTPRTAASISATATIYDANADQVPDSAYVNELVCENPAMGCVFSGYWREASLEEKQKFTGKLQLPSAQASQYHGSF